jgi:NIMA (never in mitosis gene a)-related kinase
LKLVTGAYGTAVLYKKKDDDSLVILKEINLHDLNVGERQLAQNEVSSTIDICSSERDD